MPSAVLTGQGYTYSGTYQLGFIGTSNTGNFHLRQTVVSLKPHYAVRIRFGIYLMNNQRDNYYYPLSYSLDLISYSYTQNNVGYFSCYDIVNSPLQSHFIDTLSVTFVNTNQSDPDNTAGCSICTCYSVGCGCCGCCGVGTTCCYPRYIEIRDLLVFASLCPDYCDSCISASACATCWVNYFLNEADRLCYASCPQATYINNTMYLVGNASTGAYSGYTEATQPFCVPCDPLCMECINSTQCTRCYTTGRN